MSPAPYSANSRHRAGLALAVLAGLGALSAVSGLCLARANRLRDSWPPEADTFYLPPASTLHVASLRQKLEKDPADPKYILTERGVG